MYTVQKVSMNVLHAVMKAKWKSELPGGKKNNKAPPSTNDNTGSEKKRTKSKTQKYKVLRRICSDEEFTSN